MITLNMFTNGCMTFSYAIEFDLVSGLEYSEEKGIV
jgi:hypothetical protein